MSADDDLDALLDDALDEIGEQEEAHSKAKEANDALAEQLAADQRAKALAGGGPAAGGNPDDPELAQLQSMFSTLASALQNPNSLNEPEGISKLQGTLASTIAQLQTDPNATDDERAELQRCSKLVGDLGKPDSELSPEEQARAQEAIAEMMKSIDARQAADGTAAAAAAGAADTAGAAAGGAPPAPDEAQLKQLLEMMEAFHKGQADAAAGAGDDGDAPAPDSEEAAKRHTELLQALEQLRQASGDAPAAAPPGSEEAGKAAGTASEEEMAMHAMQTMASMWSDPAFCEPFRKISGKFPAFLEESRGKLDEAEHKRYSEQARLMGSIVQLLDDGPLVREGASDEEQAQRFNAFSELVAQLQELGAPPPELVNE